MSKLTLELPASIREALAEAALRDGFSIEHFIALAIAEKLSALRTVDQLRRESEGGRRVDFERFLAAVPDREPLETDRLPE